MKKTTALFLCISSLTSYASDAHRHSPADDYLALNGHQLLLLEELDHGSNHPKRTFERQRSESEINFTHLQPKNSSEEESNFDNQSIPKRPSSARSLTPQANTLLAAVGLTFVYPVKK